MSWNVSKLALRLLADALMIIQGSYHMKRACVLLLLGLPLLSSTGCVYRTGQYERVADSYQVQSGDTLSSIAFKMTGDTSNWKLLARMNPHINPHNLRRGEIISIPRTLRKPRFGPLNQPDRFRFQRPEPAEDQWRQYPGGDRFPPRDRDYGRARDEYRDDPYRDAYREQRETPREQEQREVPREPDLRVVPLYPEGPGGEVKGMGLGAVHADETE